MRQAFTLIELLVVIVIILLLMGLLLPVLGMVRERSRRADAASLLTTVAMALQAYADEDPRHRFPDDAPGHDYTLMTGMGTDGVPGVLELIAGAGFQPRPGTLAWESEATQGVQLDAWRRPIHYRRDPVRYDQWTTVAERPDAGFPRADWNPKNSRPYPYVWSIGTRTATPEKDGLAANSAQWIVR